MVVALINVPPPEDGVRYSTPNTKAIYKQQSLGNGTLYVAESCVCWTNNEGKGFSLQYPAISLHAISKDTAAFPEPCLYLMLTDHLEDDAPAHSGEGGSESDSDDDEDSQWDASEIRFVPENEDALEFLYRAMCDCQALHPDPEVQDSDDEGGGEGDSGAYEDAEDDADGVCQENGYGSHPAEGEDAPFDAELDAYEQDGAYDGAQGDDDEPMDVGQFEDA